MTKHSFFPIVLGSDENAYGTSRLFYEKYGIKPLLCCTRQLVPTSNSRLFTIRIIKDFDKDEVFPDALLSVLKEYKKTYEKIIVIPCWTITARLFQSTMINLKDLLQTSLYQRNCLIRLIQRINSMLCAKSTAWTTLKPI